LQPSDIAPKKSPNSGRNPQLQPEASNPKIKKWSEL